MGSELYQIMYVSSAAKGFSEAEMYKLCSRIYKRNEARKLSGVLLYTEGNIIQVLEGPKDTVKALFAKIRKDTRHTGLLIISQKVIEQRDFPNFGMGFVGLDKQEIADFTNLFSPDRHFPTEQLEGLSKQVKVFLKTFLTTVRLPN